MRITRVKHVETGEPCKIYNEFESYLHGMNSEILLRTSHEGKWRSMSDKEKHFCFLRADGSFYWLAGEVRVEIIDGVQDPGA